MAVPTLFDPVAVAYAVHPTLCPVTPMHLKVDDKGFTLSEEKVSKDMPSSSGRSEGAPNAQVCLQSDEKSFMELLLGRVAKDAAR